MSRPTTDTLLVYALLREDGWTAEQAEIAADSFTLDDLLELDGAA